MESKSLFVAKLSQKREVQNQFKMLESNPRLLVIVVKYLSVLPKQSNEGGQEMCEIPKGLSVK